MIKKVKLRLGSKKIIGKANILNNGKDLTIISNSYMTSEAKLATEILKNNIGVDLIDKYN